MKSALVSYAGLSCNVNQFSPVLLFFLTAKDCSALNAPSNGSLVGNLTTYPHKVQFLCDEGFKLQGSKIRQCLSTGNWSGTDTLCDRK